MFGTDALPDAVEVNCRLGWAHSIAYARDHVKLVRAPAGDRFGGENLLDRRPNLHFSLGIAESLRHHADDVVRLAVQANLPSQDIANAPEPPLPQSVTDHDDRPGSVLILFRGERTSQ